MRTNRFIAALLLGALLVVAGCSDEEPGLDPNLVPTLQSVYQRWSDAGRAGDLVAWKAASSPHSYQRTVNGLVSMRQRLTPEILQNLASVNPDLDRYEFVGANQGRESAVLVYYGSGALPREHFLILDFFRGEEGWRFHWVNVRDDLVDAAARWAKRDMTFLNEGAFRAVEKLPEVPPDCPQPHQVAYMKIDSLGYETRVRMHGIDYPPIIDTTLETIIFGGLQRGENIMEMTMQPIATGGIKTLRASVAVLVEDDELRGMDERYVYEPEEVPPIHAWKIETP